jgi:hypothetical protein
MSIDDNRLINVFQSLIADEAFNARLNANESYSDIDSCWGLICKKYLGHYDVKVSLLIKTKYTKNTKGFRSKLKQKQCTVSMKLADLISYIGSNRPKMNAPFSHALTQKLHERQGVNCSLHCKWNWFSQENTYWNGL